MPDWLLWLIVAGGLAVGEVATLAFVMGPLALAALLAAGVAGVTDSVALQLATFAAASVGSLLLIRPIAQRHLRQPSHIRTGVAALVGRQALVLERVDRAGGQVRIGGEVWSARALDEDRVFEPGDSVDVLKIDGATALVSE